MAFDASQEFAFLEKDGAMIDKLEENGWKEFPIHKDLHTHRRNWAKRYPTKTRCALNDDKEGVQVVLRYWFFSGHGRTHESFDLQFTAELADGRWPRVEIEAGDSIESIESAVALILVAWEAMAEESK
jgi:hypothetical protein